MKKMGMAAGLIMASVCAFAGDCTVGTSDTVAVESAWMGKGSFTLEISGPGDAINSFHYRFKKTSQINGIFETTIHYEGKDFAMTCHSVQHYCDLDLKVPEGQDADILNPGTSFQLKHVVCQDSAAAGK